MKINKRHIIVGKNRKSLRRKTTLGVVLCMVLGNLFGCGLADNSTHLEKKMKSNEEYAEYYFEEVTAALETKDKEALKALFSTYAIDNTSQLEEQMEELMDYYPGYQGDYKLNISTSETSAYAGKKYSLNAQYMFSNGSNDYRMRITVYTQNIVEPDKVGLHMIQMINEGTVPEGFKWKGEEDAPGIYVVE